MKIFLERRASTVLYNFLCSIKSKGSFLLPANVCYLVPLVFMKAGCPFDLVDISPETLCINESLVLERLATGRYGGILFARTYGVDTPFEDFFKRVKDISGQIIIIDDRCLCTPVFDSPETAADLVLYSTGYAKFVDIGYGGYGFIREELQYEREVSPFSREALEVIEAKCKRRVQEKTRFEYEDSNWLDCRPLDFDDAEYMKAVVNAVEAAMRHKSDINDIYRENLPENIQFPDRFQNWRFNIAVPDKGALLERIFASGLFASSHYTSLGGIMADGNFPVAEKVHCTAINLFNDRYFDRQAAFRVVEIINEHIAALR